MLIITTDVELGMRCPECGKLDYHQLSRFAFSGCKRVEINCVCGALKLGVTTRNHKDYLLCVPCVVCEMNHTLSVTAKMLWHGEVIYLLCSETGLDLGYLGPRADVLALSAAHEESISAWADEFDNDEEYFHDPEIMYEVLNCLHDIAEQDGLYCQCGNLDVDVDFLPDRIELYCQDCGSVSIIYAKSEQDLMAMRNMDVIELTPSGFRCLDNVAFTGKTSKTGKKKRHKRK